MGQQQAKSSEESNVPNSPLIGLRVVRGPDWKWKHQDGGEGHVGTIVNVSCSKGGREKAVVLWDHGIEEANCRCSDEYDLCIFDNAPSGVRHLGISCKECNAADIAGIRWRCTVCKDLDLCTNCYMADLHDTGHAFARRLAPGSSEVPLPPRQGSASVEALGMFCGARVVRFRDWSWGGQDGGSEPDGKEGTETGIVVGPADFGAKGVRDAVRVRWAVRPEQERTYRVGHDGKVDLKCSFVSSGGRYYPAHLPLAGAEDASPFKVGDLVRYTQDESTVISMEKVGDDGGRVDVDLAKQAPLTDVRRQVGVVRRIGRAGKLDVEFYGQAKEEEHLSKDLVKVVRYKVGDFVKIDADESKVKACQRSHWVDSMIKVLGKVGEVKEVFDDGELGVDVEGRFLVLNPLVCNTADEKERPSESSSGIGGSEAQPGQKGPTFKMEDIVTVIADIDLARPLQKGHGGWNGEMKEALGKTGKVVKVHPNGDLRVKVNKKSWTFNPKCLTMASKADRDAYVQRATSGSSSSSGSDLSALLRPGHSRVRVKVRMQHRSQRPQQEAAFSVGDVITTLSDVSKVTELQSGPDLSQSDLSKILGMTGKVKQSLPSGNLKVSDGNRSWILNPKCVQLSRNAGMECSRYEEDILPSRAELMFDSDAELVKAVMRSTLSRVQKILAKAGKKVNTKFKGIAPLHVATIRGRLDVMKLLLDTGADVTVKDDKDNTALHHAAIIGNSFAVQLLLEYKSPLDHKNERQQTALHSAAAALLENEGITELLLKHGCDPNVQDSDGNTALHLAIFRNNCTTVKLLVDGSADLKIKNNLGFNALHQAVLCESIFAVKTIVAKATEPSSCSADLVNETSSSGLSALHLAAARGYTSLADVLLHEEKVNKDLRGPRGDTPLLLAVRHGHTEVAGRIVDHHADVTAKDEKGNTCLHLEAIRHRLLCGRSSVCCLVSRHFLLPTISEADLMVTNNEGKNALDIVMCEAFRSQLLQVAQTGLAPSAASSGDRAADEPASLKFVVGSFVQVTSDLAVLREQQIGHGGWSPAMANAAGSEGKVVWVFPTGDLRVYVGKQNWTLNPACCCLKPPSAAVSQAVGSGDSSLSGSSDNDGSAGGIRRDSSSDSDSDSEDDLVRLVTHGKPSALQTKINRKPKEKLNARVGDVAPLHVAAGRGKVDAARMLLDAGADANVRDVDDDRPLHHAAVRGQPAIIELLLAKGAQADSRNKNGHTALHYAAGASSEDVSCVTALLANPNGSDTVNLQDSDGDTALHCAITKNNKAIVAKLVDHYPKTDLDLRNQLGFNALHYATLRGDDSTVSKILDKAPDLVNRPNNRGHTALHLAAVHGHKSIVDTLLKAKAGIELRTERGGRQTPLLLAIAHGHKDVVERLLKHGADVTVHDDAGDSCLHVALRRHRLLCGVPPDSTLSSESIALMQLLQDFRCDWKGEDDKGRTAADIAASLRIPMIRDQERVLLQPSPQPAPAAVSVAGADSLASPALEATARTETLPGQASTVQQKQPEPRTTTDVSSSSGRCYQEGDIVQVLDERDVVKRRQKGHGGWNNDMTSALGRAGRVLSVDSDGDVRVRMGAGGHRWVFNPRCLVPATEAKKAELLKAQSLTSELKEGTWVRVIADSSKARELQKGHGGWNDAMGSALGQIGTVVDVDKDGDARVRIAGRRWTFNPLCLELVTDAKEMQEAQQQQGPSFKSGDLVKVIDDLSKAKELQKGHGGWNDSMESALGQLATVIEIDRDDDVRVRVRGRRWVFNPACLTMASEADKAAREAELPQQTPFKPGDQVKIIADVEKVQELQKGHGGWTRSMHKALGKVGNVIEVDSDNDVRVRMHRHMWVFNPQCLVPYTTTDDKEMTVGWSGSDLSSSSSDSDDLSALLKSLKKRLVSDGSSDESSKRETGSHSPRGHDGSSKFSIGNMVTVLSDGSKVRDLQAGHGDWVSDMEKVLGRTGKVKDIFSSGDLRVQFRDNTFTLNPECCTLATEAQQREAVDLLSTSSSSSDGILSALRGERDNKLVDAVTHGTPSDVKKILLKSKAKVNSKVAGLAPLHVAAGKGAAESMLLLLEADADVGMTDKDGDTPLHHASISGETDAVQVLLDYAAWPNARNQRGLTPLHYAVLAAKGDQETTTGLPVRLLEVCNVNIQDNEGDTALHVAITRDCAEMIGQLVAHPSIDLARMNNVGRNALHLAVHQGNDTAVKQIVTRAGGLVDVLNGCGLSALHMAAVLGRKSAAEILLKEGGANVKLKSDEKQTARKQTALMYATAHCHKDIVELLIDKGADVADRDENGNTCLQIAKAKHRLLYGDAPEGRSQLINYLQSVHDPAAGSVRQ